MQNNETRLSDITKFKAMDYVQLAVILGLLSLSVYLLSKELKKE